MFRRIVVSACLAGLLGGLVLTGVQWFQVVPIIAQAEIYEPAGTVPKTHSNGSDHDHAAWAPGEGGERTLWTAIANVGMAIGFTLLLVAIFSLRENVTWRQGLLWGLGGFAAFFALPAVGLAPELPGTATAALEQRQVWWVMTVAMSAAGLALAALGRSWALKAVGVVLVLAPHALGAPQPETHSALAPSDLSQTFVFATALANAVFWLVLGASSAIAFKKLA
jgi:cobalt transporter subunit CbtA